MADEVFTIFVSSPGDVGDERAALRDVVRRLSYDPFIDRFTQLRVVSWDESAAPVPLLASEHPQSGVESMLPRPSECDIVIGIFWSRLGTPVPAATGGRHGQGMYPSGTAREIDDALSAASRVGGPDVLLYHKRAPATVPLGATDWQARGEQYAALQAYLAELRQRGRSIESFTTLDEFRSVLDSHLRHVIARRVGSARGWYRHRTGWPGTRAPFPGLLAFTPADRDVFFGRDAEVDALVSLVRRAPLVAVVGPSGSGKSSIIGAGLIPWLDAAGGGEDRWLTPRFDPAAGTWTGTRLTPASGGGPLRSLAVALDPADSGGSGYAQRCRRGCAALRGAGVMPLVYVDQFEETYGTADPASAELVDTLVGLADDGLATVVLSLRADFLGAALHHEGLARHMRAATLPLGPPGLAAIRQMITEPARVAGLVFEDDLADLLMVDVGREPGRLPLLAFALALLYHSREGNRLTHAAYERIGGVHGAVGRLAEQCVQQLAEPVGDDLSAMFGGLVEVDEVGGPIRRKMPLAGLRGEPRRRALVEALAAARLLVVCSDPGAEPYVELAHEALFRGWPRLADWIDTAHGDLRELSRMRRAAADWMFAGQDPSLLWPQERMDGVHAAAARLAEPLGETERAFLRPEAQRLLDEIDLPGTNHTRRREISRRLVALGDRRPGVGVRPDRTPDIVWCAVPADASGPAFWIGKYLVTVTQRDGCRPRPDETYDHALDDGRVNSLPADVSWNEAAVFCSGLNWRRGGGAHLPAGAPAGYEVRLPSRDEWIRAAGPARYPWGDEFDDHRANTADAGLGEPIAVGMYPGGNASCGAADLAGSMWEWCMDDLGHADDDDRETHFLRPLKGGSALEPPQRCQVQSTRTMRGDVSRPDRGFRVCYGPGQTARGDG